MVFSTIDPSSNMDGKEGLYLFITLMWGILILVSDYTYANTLLGSVWMIFGIMLIFTSIYVWSSYCIYPILQNWSQYCLECETKWYTRLIQYLVQYFS